jgi:hypothetical protein
VEWREDVYDYAPVPWVADAVEWHVNFADARLFVAYGSALFAQDEMQVAEHPALGALKEALTAHGAIALTAEPEGPTPILVKGVERRVSVATDANPAEERPRGLYGNAFASASEHAVRRATRRLDPATITSLIAISAPSGGFGPYTSDEIRYVLSAACTGFRAARLESEGAPSVVHSGFWGCGAFGGHRELMMILQVLAAQMAGTDRLVLHTVRADGARTLRAALAVIKEQLGPATMTTTDLIARVEAMRYQWGVSDGN